MLLVQRSTLYLLIAAAVSAKPSPLRIDQYPSPDQCPPAHSSRLCDVDGLLTNTDNDNSNDILSQLLAKRRTIRLADNCMEGQDKDTDSPSSFVPIEFAVALLGKMDLSTIEDNPLFEFRNDPDQAAELFARSLHDRWGVGARTPHCGGTGLLLFLSQRDRRIYLSRGAALEAVLTNRRVDAVIEGMKPLLVRNDYDGAVIQALNQLDDFLVAGEPDWKERMIGTVTEYGGLAFVLFFFGLAARSTILAQRRKREYAQVASQLNEIDQARAEALQGRFRCQSCPICLETFPETKTPTQTAATIDTAGEDAASESEQVELVAQQRMGSDGQPLKLLRCGHVFDETCWAEWVHSGQGQVDRCPVCGQDVGTSIQQQQHSNAPTNRGGLAVRGGGGNNSVTEMNRDEGDNDNGSDRDSHWALRRYTQDRNFRLARLGHRYPDYVRPQQLQRWTQTNYDGSLSNDPSFVKSNPATREMAEQHRSGFGDSGGHFGGGSSGGGRGGSW